MFKLLSLHYHNLVSTDSNAELKITQKNENCSVMSVDFQRNHDTKNGIK